MLITADEAPIGNIVIPLKQKVDEALKKNTTSIKHVLVAKRTGNSVTMSDRDISIEEVRLEVVYSSYYCKTKYLYI